MKFSLLPLAFVLASSAFASDLPPIAPDPVAFAPASAIPVAASHPAWEIKVSVESKGLPLRAVLAAAFDTAKISYAIDPSLDQTIYASVKDVTLRDGVAILNKLADFEVRSEKGVWYAARRTAKSVAQSGAKIVTAPVSITKTAPKAAIAPSISRSSAPIDTQAILVDATPRSNGMVPMKVTPPAGLIQKLPAGNANSVQGRIPWGAPLATSAPTKVITKSARTGNSKIASQSPESSSKPEISTSKPALMRRVNTKLPKTDLRKVFETYSQQTGVAITVDESVPRYKIDSYMKGCSLKYALDRICEAAGLKYESHGAAIRIVKA